MRKKIDSGTTLEAECSFGLRLGSKLIDEIPHTLVSTSETLSPVTAVQDNSTACQSPSSFAQILSPSTRDRGRHDGYFAEVRSMEWPEHTGGSSHTGSSQ